MEKKDIVAFLNQFQKPEDKDQKHKWIGTYNITVIHITRFFKWLYFPDENARQRPIPLLLKNIGKKTRLEEESYSAADLWTNADDGFL
jgi:hypothetical protein